MQFDTYDARMKHMRYIRLLAVIALATFSIFQLHAQISIATWNIRDLGRSKDNTEIHTIAQHLRDYDIVLIQEVVAGDPAGAQAVARLEAALDRMGAEWDSRVSDPTQSSSPYITERYAILWKPSRARMIGRPRLVSELANEINREPFEATFQADGMTFTVLNLHARPRTKQPEREVKALIRYILDNDDITFILAGDFNVTEDHTVFNPLYRYGYTSALDDQKTTLNRTCKSGSYLHYAYDNIFFPKAAFRATNAGVIDHVGNCENLTVASGVSDHLGVYVRLR